MKHFERLARKYIVSESMRDCINALYAAKPKTKGIPSIEDVKKALLELTGIDSWETFASKQESGDCEFIARAVSRMFPKLKFVSVKISFSQQAIDKMEPDDDPEWFTCVHYLNKLGDEYLDFAKHSNVYENAYALDGVDDIDSFTYSKEALKHFSEEQIENPKDIGVVMR